MRIQHVVFSLPAASVDRTDYLQLIDDHNRHVIVGYFAGVDGRSAEGTGVDVFWVFVVDIAEILEARLAEGVPEL